MSKNNNITSKNILITGATGKMEENTNEVLVNENDKELYEHYRFVVDKGQKPLRIDKYLSNRLDNTSRNKIQEAAEAGNILVNQKSVKSNYKVKSMDVVSVVLEFPPREIEIIPENIPLNVVYEDNDLIVINKVPGMVVHPSYGHYRGTLVNALAYRMQNNPIFETGDHEPGLVHRIDKDTSGIMLAAKNLYAKMRLAKQFFDRTINRRYYALVWGDFDKNTGTITGHIGRSLYDRKIMTVYPDGEHGKHAVTHYRVVERFGYVTLIECKLETGRTHQIRVHLRYIGHPLFSDKKYGGNKILKGTTFAKYRQFIDNCFKILPRQALHAKSLEFEHPSTGERLSFDSDLPDDMQQVINKWRHYVANRTEFQ